jgi:hypothetical protein
MLFLMFSFSTFRPAQAGQEVPELFLPVISVVINDNPEGQRVCGIYDHKDAKFPCRQCWLLFYSNLYCFLEHFFDYFFLLRVDPGPMDATLTTPPPPDGLT